jgi:hypothetical protein
MTEEEWLACEDPELMLRFREINNRERRFLEDPNWGEGEMGLTLDWGEGGSIAVKGQCDRIRCIVPYRPQTIDPSWLTSTVVSLAQQMYDSRDFSAHADPRRRSSRRILR